MDLLSVVFRLQLKPAGFPQYFSRELEVISPWFLFLFLSKKSLGLYNLTQTLPMLLNIMIKNIFHNYFHYFRSVWLSSKFIALN